MKIPSITEAEWTVMEVLWEEAPKTAGEVIKGLRDSTGWADNTIRTLLTRLVEKGALKTKGPEAGARLYLPAVKREACVRAEGESFMQRIFGGAAKPLLIHFAQNSKLTAEEVRELKKILDQSLDS